MYSTLGAWMTEVCFKIQSTIYEKTLKRNDKIEMFKK